MGKGFQNFMSKKDFHPSAWWNLKKKWELEEKQKMEQKKEEEMRIQYEKEQDMINNKALLGDEKARLGLSFMYDAPAGINRKKEEGPEPKFEWQRKYNAPREEWAKGNEQIQDQPFGIQVRNVRCVKCRTWGHLNTDRECPLYGMSGNADNHGYKNNPSDLIRALEEERKQTESDQKPNTCKDSKDVKPRIDIRQSSPDDQEMKPTLPKDKSLKRSADSEDEYEGEDEEQKPMVRVDQEQLLEDMREEHNLRFKTGVLMTVRADEGIKNLTSTLDDEEEEQRDVKPSFEEFLKTLSEKKSKKILSKIMSEANGSHSKSSKEHKKDKKAKKEKKKEKKHKKEKHRHRH